MAGFDKVLGQKRGVMVPDTAVAKSATDFSSSIEATGKLVTDTFEGVVVNDFLSDSSQTETQVVNTPDNRVEGNIESKEITFSNRVLGAKNIVSAMNQGKLSKSAARSKIQARLRTAINENPAHEAALIKSAEKSLGLGGGSGGSGGGGIFDESNEEKLQRKREETQILAADKQNREDLANANLLGKSLPDYRELQQITAQKAEINRQTEEAIAEQRVGGVQAISSLEGLYEDQMGALLMEASTAKPDGVYSVQDQVTLTNSAEQTYNVMADRMRQEVQRYPNKLGLREDTDKRLKVMADARDDYIKSVKSGASLELNRDRLANLQAHASIQEFQKSGALVTMNDLYGNEYMAKGNTRYKQMVGEIRSGKPQSEVVLSVEDQRFWNAFDPEASKKFSEALKNPSTLPSADALTQKIVLSSAAGVIASTPPPLSNGAEATDKHIATVTKAMTLPLTEGADPASLLSLNTASARQAFANSPALSAELVNRVGTLFGDLQREANDLRVSPNSYRWELSKDEQGKSQYVANITGDLTTKQRQAVEDMQTTINSIYIPVLSNHPETLGTQNPEDILNSLNEKAVGTIPNEQDKLDTATSNLEQSGFEVKQERGFFELTDKNGEFYNPAVDAVKGAVDAYMKSHPINVFRDLRDRFNNKIDKLEKEKGERLTRDDSRAVERDASLVQDFFEEPTVDGANAVIRNSDTTTPEEQTIAKDYLTAIEGGASVTNTTTEPPTVPTEVAPITPAPNTDTAQSFAIPEEGAATEVIGAPTKLEESNVNFNSSSLPSIFDSVLPILEGSEDHVDHLGNGTKAFGVVNDSVNQKSTTKHNKKVAKDMGIDLDTATPEESKQVAMQLMSNIDEKLSKDLPEYSSLSDNSKALVIDAKFNTGITYKGLTKALVSYEADASQTNLAKVAKESRRLSKGKPHKGLDNRVAKLLTNLGFINEPQEAVALGLSETSEGGVVDNIKKFFNISQMEDGEYHHPTTGEPITIKDGQLV